MSGTLAYNVDSMLQESLTSKGRSLATNIVKRNENAMMISGNTRLENVLTELITDEEIAYTTIADNQGKLLTSQFESINYNWPGLNEILPKLPKGIDLPDILEALKKDGYVREISLPIMLGVDLMGKVTIGLSETRIREQITKTVLFVVALNLIIALVLGTALFIATKKIILDPIVVLSRATSRLAAGHLLSKVDIKSSGEIQMLADSFNEMAENLNTTTVSKKYVDNIINSMMDSLVVLSPENQIVLVNPATCRLLGYDAQELIGKPLEKIFYNGEADCKALFDEILIKGFVNNMDTSYRTKDGKKVLMLFSGSLITEGSMVSGISCVAIDITEQERMRDELLKLDKLESVGALAGGLAHDFNNLLQGVFGYISLAKMKSASDGEVYKMLEHAEKALNLSTNLTQQLLTFSKGGEPIKKVVQLPLIITHSVRLALSGSNIDCQFTIDDPLWPVEADEGQLSQVMQNMVINASDAMPTGGTIHIVVRNISNDENALPLIQAGKYVLINIEDSGEGIPEEYIKKIFDPYFTTKEKGNGLGLAASFSIVKKHGGIIEVQSELGEGATFSIYLPASEKNISPAIQEESMLQTGSGKILVMDDDEIIRTMSESMLSTLGFRVELAVNGEEALAKYAQAMASGRVYDGVILDLTIKGGMGGKETIAKLIELDPGVRAIVSSGYSEDPVMANFHEYGFQAALAKPFPLAKLSEILQKLM
ncbi:MAG: PAS domain S-box protein [Proteobacteria bacterium]|nr:PAS domain S-box protein [Pseudomonadota bacterium]MBU4393547.1 PAS domain S-box protein [Pseudomonadota bacterium]MBU4586565.1 PAS domain S-box protein [Pseudomonadota bacterium]